MRLLFLDFDGVLHPWWAEAASHFCWLNELEALLDGHPDVYLVVHSSWRYSHLDFELRAKLGRLATRFVGSAPKGPREQAIEMVLQANRGEIESYLVLDDDAKEFTQGRLNVLLVDGDVGISSAAAKQAVAVWLESPSTKPTSQAREV